MTYYHINIETLIIRRGRYRKIYSNMLVTATRCSACFWRGVMSSVSPGLWVESQSPGAAPGYVTEETQSHFWNLPGPSPLPGLLPVQPPRSGLLLDPITYSASSWTTAHLAWPFLPVQRDSGACSQLAGIIANSRMSFVFVVTVTCC